MTGELVRVALPERGGPLLGDAFAGGDLSALHDRAQAFVEVCAR